MPVISRYCLSTCKPIQRSARWAAWAWLAFAGAAPAFASPQTLRLHEGTGIAVSASADGMEILTDLAGRLWRFERHNGTASALTPEGEVAQRPTVSPDGARIAYQSLRDGFYQIVLMNREGGSARQLTSGRFHHMAPSWSPDGRRLLVASNRAGSYDVWELDAEQLTLSPLSFDPRNEFDPVWSPGGDAIAYVRDDGRGSSLCIREAGNPVRVVVANGQRLRAPAWRPDGSLITFVAQSSAGSQLNMVILSEPPVVKELSRTEDVFPLPAHWLGRERYLYTANGRIRERELGGLAPVELPFSASLSVLPATPLTQRTALALARESPVRGLRGIATLPDGGMIVAALGNLWELDASGALRRQITNDPYADADPAVSRDGRSLVFVSDRTGSPQLWVMDVPTGETRQLTAENDLVSLPAWNGSGDRVAYLALQADANRTVTLKAVDARTGSARTLATGLGAGGTPAWTPGDTGVAMLQGTQLSIFRTDGAGFLRRMTLLSEAVGTGDGELQWSASGRTVAIGSPGGITLLPVLDSGMVGAEWRRVSAAPADRIRWARDDREIVFIGPGGLQRIAVDEPGAAQPVALPLSVPAGGTAGRLVVRAGRVFNGTDPAYLHAQDIVIDGNRIVDVRPWGTPEPGARVIDARTRTVMPGLIDVALRLDAPVGERIGRRLLAYGITAVQAESTTELDLQEVSERWQASRAGPRLFMRSLICAGDLRLPAPTEMGGITGVRFCDGQVAGPDPAAVRAAREAGLAIWGHGWMTSLSRRVDVVSQFEPIQASGAGAPPILYQDAIETLIHSGVAFVPALSTGGLAILAGEDGGRWLAHRQFEALTPAAERERLQAAWRRSAGTTSARQLSEQQRTIGRIAAGGGRLAVASGSPATPYGLGLHAELALMAHAGLKPARVLSMATAEAARLLGLASHLGAVAPGRLADLLVLAGDPLDDVTQALRLDMVIANGEPRTLDELLDVRPALEKLTDDRGTDP
jgi:Tol biopolymer transport system component